MDASDWIAAGSAVAAIGSIGVTIQIARSSMRVNKEVAGTARETLDEATKLTAIESERRAGERQDWHIQFKPPPPAEIIAELRKGTPTDTLFGSITVPNGYRVKADAYFHVNGKTNLSVSSALHPNQPYDFQIEQWPPGSEQPITKEIRVRFWPPLEGDGVDVWTCPCGRPTGEGLDGDGHWEWRVPVSYTPPKSPATAQVRTAQVRRSGLFGPRDRPFQ